MSLEENGCENTDFLLMPPSPLSANVSDDGFNPEIWENLAQTRPTWRGEVDTGAAIYKTNRIAAAAAKAEREALKSQVPRLHSTNPPPLRTCPRCQRTFRARVGLVGHPRIQCAINSTTYTSSPTLAPAANPAPIGTPVTADDTVAVPPSPSTDIIRPAPTPSSTSVA
nr:unnamed protein product [Spirometra erinaceieuropaei]